MIPEGWKREPLMNVAKIQTGIAKGKQGLKDPVEVPYLRVANVQDGHLNLSEIKTIMVERTKIERFSLKTGDVLMTEGGDFDKLGRGDVWQGQIDPCLHQNHVFCVRPNIERIIPYFLSSLSGSNYGKYYFLSCAKRSTNLASINSTQLKEFPVLIPPLSEQKKIAQILSTWDAAIETVEKLIGNSQQKKKTLMQQLLTGKKRFPSFDGEWKKVRLGDIGEISSAGVDKKIIEGEKTVRLLNYLDVLNRDFIADAELNHWVTAPERKAQNCDIQQGDVFFTPSSETREDIAHSAVAIESIPNAVYSYHIVRFRLNDSWDLNFRTYAFKTEAFYKQAYSLCEGSGQRYVISQRYFRNMTVRIPVLIEEQRKIGLALKSVDDELLSLQEQLTALKREKKALMQQLLTGKRRVKPN